MQCATKLALALLPVLLFANAHAFNGAGGKMGGRMGGKAGMSPPASEQAGDSRMADMNPEVAGAFMPTRANPVDMRKRGFFATGLAAVYPAEASCPSITSHFADAKRSDGSTRSPRYYQGLHSGVDIPAPEGTPVLAMADGTVVHKGEGENIGGIGIVLQHAPEQTGLPFYAYTEYKHLVKLPDFPVGHRLNKGEELGQAGISGTTDGYYGEEGFSHLHLSAWYSESAEYKAGRMFVPVGGQWMDPLAFLKGMPLDSASVEKLPREQKRVAVAYKTGDGKTRPAAAKVIWPFVCQAK